MLAVVSLCVRVTILAEVSGVLALVVTLFSSPDRLTSRKET
jgi:hypothetical protein